MPKGLSRQADLLLKSRRPALLDQLAAAPAGRQRRVLEAFVQDAGGSRARIVCRTKIDARQPLNELGLDSLMAVEFRNTLSGVRG